MKISRDKTFKFKDWKEKEMLKWKPIPHTEWWVIAFCYKDVSVTFHSIIFRTEFLFLQENENNNVPISNKAPGFKGSVLKKKKKWFLWGEEEKILREKNNFILNYVSLCVSVPVGEDGRGRQTH